MADQPKITAAIRIVELDGAAVRVEGDLDDLRVVYYLLETAKDLVKAMHVRAAREAAERRIMVAPANAMPPGKPS